MCAALVENSVLYVFDMSTISLPSEDVVYSEVHIFKRRRWSRRFNKSPRFPDVDVAVGVFELMPSSLTQLASLTVTRQSAGWLTLNVTDVVSALKDRSTQPMMLAISFADMVRISRHIERFDHSESAATKAYYLLYNKSTAIRDK